MVRYGDEVVPGHKGGDVGGNRINGILRNAVRPDQNDKKVLDSSMPFLYFQRIISDVLCFSAELCLLMLRVRLLPAFSTCHPL